MGTSREQANSYDVLPCDRVVTIPQYIGKMSLYRQTVFLYKLKN